MLRLLLSIVLSLCCAVASAAPLTIVAAESTYGAIASAIAGADARVDSIIRDPNTDPHEFEASVAVARQVADADIVLLNGIGYDGWMDKLLAANPSPQRQLVVAAALAGGRVLPDHNPHLFYDTTVARRVAQRLAQLLEAADAQHASAFAARLQQFDHRLDEVDQAIAALRQAHPGLVVTATEPVYGYMLRQLGWSSRNMAFQFNVMNDSEPSPATAAAFENDLRQHRVALLFANRQVSDSLTRHMQDVARASAVPVVGVDEFLTSGADYPGWLSASLHATSQALTQH